MEGSTLTGVQTINEAFRRTAERHPDRVALRTKDDEVSLTWGQLRDRVDALAGGLAKLGVGRGDTVALMIGNRPEFNLADLACITLGACPFSIYFTASPEEIAFQAGDAGAKLAFAEQQFLPRLLEARKELPALEHVVVVDGDAPEGTLALADVEGSNPGFDAEAAARAIRADDLLTIIYTSGTTGPPKGVQLTHANLVHLVTAVESLIAFPDDSRVISWLPNAHIAERAAHHYLPLFYGFEVTCCPDAREIMGYLPAVRPNWFFAVPRIWEKLKSGLETMIANQPDEQREQAQRALEAAIQRVRLIQAGEDVPEELERAYQQADQAMFAGLRATLGLDQVETVNVGAAPTPVEVLEFFHAIGIEIAELWGLSETAGVATTNPPHEVKIGTVGKAIPRVEVKLAEDGEVLVRGPGNMVGYRNQPEKTAEAIDGEGWLHTGDIGELDDDGYLRIVDRKKELIINAAGKNMSPANIESHVKSASPLIGQAAAIGDRRPYNVALIVLDADFAPAWAAQHGREDTSLEALADDPDLRAEVQKGIDAANARMARVEQVKKFTIVRGDWLPGGDELTPTMKLKRKPIDRKYADVIEDLYAS